MHSPTRSLLAVALGVAVALMCGAPALASGPATVTVRVEGAGETLVPATRVTTTAQPVVNDGNPEHACSGYSALGALQLATAGNWSGKWYGEGLGYEIATIDGESHPFSSGAFWDLWIGHSESLEGACEAEPESGSEVLFFPCPEAAAECPHPLGLEAPASASVGEPVSVEVLMYGKTGTAAPVAGAVLSGASTSATTDARGRATVTFTQTGQQTLRASAPEAVRDEVAICVHNGNDGTCGTLAGSSPTPNGSASTSANGSASSAGGSAGGGSAADTSAVPYKGPYALVADVSDPTDGAVYTRARAPRILSGRILSHSAVTSVSLELRRSYRGRCYAYAGARERFERARCGSGKRFIVSTSAAFSYLLPERLRPGRYVLDVHASDVAGNHIRLALGTSRIIFYVR